MRPQHITAENRRGRRPAGRGQPASMRPQHITAENGPNPKPPEMPQSLASMRPQHITAENVNDIVPGRLDPAKLQ